MGESKREERVMGEAKNNIPKGYRHRSFVMDCELLDKLQNIADGQERSLNWLVVRILKEYCEVRDGKIDDAK